MFPLESPHRGDSNEYTQYTIFNINNKNTLNYTRSAAMGFFSKGLKNEFETSVVNEPSVFEPLKFYSIFLVVGQSPVTISLALRARVIFTLRLISNQWYMGQLITVIKNLFLLFKIKTCSGIIMGNIRSIAEITLILPEPIVHCDEKQKDTGQANTH